MKGSFALGALLLGAVACVGPQLVADERAGGETAIFAGGCFWCTEHDFEEVPGVLRVTSGYIGGHVANPTYEQVAGHHTGHAEAVEVIFDPKRVTYRQLVDRFWHLVDPTTADRQFCDWGGVGGPYRSEIFYLTDAQKRDADASLQEVERTKSFSQPIVTKITAATKFYRAEEYHQDYWKKNQIHYKMYRAGCGRDRRLAQLWGAAAGK
ncbi:MAG TPA: peptide-methionine (S)-S-oxide reductase MsrA [Vicinamibacteria bacterium]|nr:peptide-methionine (S)-S-oxide reductase MsrA [Vicinamibacteria bacterium]